MRFGMTNPPYMLDHLPTIAKFLNHPRVFSFIHIPVQSGSNAVLEGMNREYTVEEFEKVCDYLIEKVEGLTVATDIICGFPRETTEQFEETVELVKKYKFPVVNISQFYPRPGTAAAKMDKVPTHIVKERSSKITKVFHSFDKFSKMVGQTYRVWINEKEENKGVLMLVGHTKNYVKVSIPYEEGLIK
jgi:threonylcarbamoyladenosine tRNA methylthiotransferase CDKAL1